MPAAFLDGAEPYRSWNGPHGVLLLHGLTGTPQSLRRLAGCLADASFSVELPLLPGHGTSVKDLASTSFDEIATAAAAALADLCCRCEQVVVLGLSMGGTLACQLAESTPDVAGVVLVNPLVAPPARAMLELLEKAIAGGSVAMPPIASDVARSDAHEVGYDEMPLAPLLELLAATSAVADGLEKICSPVLLFSSRVDHVVPGESSDLVEERVAGPIERVMLEHSYHVATLDHDAAEIEARTIAFCEKVFA